MLGWTVLLAEIGVSVFAVPFVRFTAGDCVSASLSPRITRQTDDGWRDPFNHVV